MTITTPLSPRSASGPARRSVVAAATATSALLVLDSTVLGVMLPTIDSALAGSDAQHAAMAAAYLIALAVALPLAGWLTDRIGPFAAFTIGTAGFVLSSMGIAFASTASEFIAWRVAAGLAAAVMMPGNLSLISRTFDGDARTRAMAIATGLGQGIAVLGPAIGGFCAQFVGWQIGFLINVPIGFAALALVLLWQPAHKPGLDQKASASVVAETMTPDGSPHKVAPGDGLRSRAFRSSLLVLGALGFGMTVATLAGAVLLQSALHLTAAAGGLAMLPMVVPSLAATLWLARSRSTPPFWILGLSGSLSMLVGLSLVAVGLGSGALAVVLIGLVPTGVGTGLLLGPMTSAALAMAPPDRHGTAAALASAVCQGSGGLGIIVCTIVSTETSPASGFAVAALALALGVIGSLGLRPVTINAERTRRRSQRARTTR